jgi:large subunit ribosomal protein L13
MRTANNCFQAKKGEVDAKWYVVDATDQVLGRLAARIATVLMGKNKPQYTPHIDTGDFVIVTNADKVKVTGKKREQQVYQSYSYYPSGLKEWTMQQVLDRHPERVLEAAVRRMMPKTKLGRHMMSRLKLYAGPTHKHQAQMPEPLPLD